MILPFHMEGWKGKSPKLRIPIKHKWCLGKQLQMAASAKSRQTLFQLLSTGRAPEGKVTLKNGGGD